MNLELKQEGSQLNLLFANEAGKVLQIHRELMGMGKTMIERMIEAGEILTRVNQGLPHGAWMPWVQMHIAELKQRLSFRTCRARRFLLNIYDICMNKDAQVAFI
jgi:hypothetical protein